MIQPVDTGADIAQPVIGIGVETAVDTSAPRVLPGAGTAVVLEAEFEWDPTGLFLADSDEQAVGFPALLL